ncbi:hypothetical protein C8Q76DRAFT_616910, partial [Earliella scabrosa]
LERGDYLLSRDIHGSMKEEDDVIQVWVTSDEVITKPLREGIDAAQRAGLGERQDRSPCKPTKKPDGSYEGGTAFERHDLAAHVRNAPRCYTLAQSYQVQRNIAAAPIAIASLEAAPKRVSEALKRQADVTNLPRVGCNENYAFPTMQLNIAATQPADALALPRMKEDFGSFGGKHIDEHDCIGGYTSMITHSDLDDDDHPGYFIIGDLGIAVCTGILSFAALPGNKTFQMPPEFIDPRYDHEPIVTNVANWVNSGWYLSSPDAYLQFYYRGLCQMAHHFGRQAPPPNRIEIDFKKLAECFSLVDKDGVVHKANFWELHPGSTASSSEFGCTRQDSVAEWEKYNATQAKHVAHASHLLYMQGQAYCLLLIACLTVLFTPQKRTKRRSPARASASMTKATKRFKLPVSGPPMFAHVQPLHRPIIREKA